MEIIDPDSIFTLSKEITLKALETGLISTDKDNMKTTAQNIASFYDVPGFLSRIVLIFFYRVVCLRHVCLGCFLWYSISVDDGFRSANFMVLQR